MNHSIRWVIVALLATAAIAGWLLLNTHAPTYDSMPANIEPVEARIDDPEIASYSDAPIEVAKQSKDGQLVEADAISTESGGLIGDTLFLYDDYLTLLQELYAAEGEPAKADAMVTAFFVRLICESAISKQGVADKIDETNHPQTHFAARCNNVTKDYLRSLEEPLEYLFAEGYKYNVTARSMRLGMLFADKESDMSLLTQELNTVLRSKYSEAYLMMGLMPTLKEYQRQAVQRLSCRYGSDCSSESQELWTITRVDYCTQGPQKNCDDDMSMDELQLKMLGEADYQNMLTYYEQLVAVIDRDEPLDQATLINLGMLGDQTFEPTDNRG